jgi:hypothetical protein
MQKDGKSAYETGPAGTKLSRLFVSLEVEPTAPWQHVQWLMTAAAAQKYYKIELTDGTRKMLNHLPVDRGINALPREPVLEIKVSVHALARREQEAAWGDIAVLRPTEIRYKIGNDETGDLATVKDYVTKAHRAVKETPGAQISGEIKAGHKVPFGKVLDLLDTFEAAGLASMSFYGSAPPSPQVCKAARLPYPPKNYDVAD